MSASTAFTDNSENSYQIDKELYDSATAIRDEMNLTAERLSKMEERKNEVSEAVYLRVKSDYLAQYDRIKKNFELKRKEIQKSLEHLYQGETLHQQELQTHKDVLEEAKFRNFLGEHSDKKYKEIENRENAEISRLDHLIQSIQNNIKQYVDLVGPDINKVTAKVESLKTTSPVEKKEVKEAAVVEESWEDSISIPAPAEAEAAESEDYFLGGSYFETQESSEPVAFENKKSSKAKPFEESSLTRVKTEKFKSKFSDIAEPKPNTNSNTNFDDSISSILRSIPLDEAEEVSAPLPEEAAPSPETIIAASAPEDEERSLNARLVCIEGDLNSQEILLSDNMSIGRSPSNDIVLKEAKVSRQHAAINFIDGQHVVVDLKSSNGIYVNGERAEEHALKEGDELTVGNSKFVYHLG